MTFNLVKPRPGDVVVFRFFINDQNDKVIFYVKRVKRISSENVFVEGDYKEISANLGPIKMSQIVGKVILKY